MTVIRKELVIRRCKVCDTFFQDFAKRTNHLCEKCTNRVWNPR